MSASPFGCNPISLGEFITVCKDKFGAELVVLNCEIQGNFGSWRPCALERSEGITQYHVVLPNFDNDVLLDFPVIRQMCDRLRIPTSEFGFDFNPLTGDFIEIDSLGSDS